MKRRLTFYSLLLLFTFFYSPIPISYVSITKLTIGDFNAPSIVYASKYFLLNATVVDLDGVWNLKNVTVELSRDIILAWKNDTDIFSEFRDPNNYCTLDSQDSLKFYLNSTAYKLCWRIKLDWAYPEMSVSILPVNTKVYDGEGSSSSRSYKDLFIFKDDIIVANAMVSNPIISIDFDDGWSSIYDLALPVLAGRKIPARANIITSNVGLEGFMTWSQIKELQDVYGWEIGSHTLNHPDLTKLSSAELDYELSKSKFDLESHGLKILSFAVPYSSYNDTVLSQIAKYYKYARINVGSNVYPYFRDLQALFFNVANDTSFDTVKAKIDEAVENDRWLILLFHTIVEESADVDTKYELLDFERIVDYIDNNRNNITPLPFSSALGTLLNSNLIINPSFEELTGGWADGWDRTDKKHISIDVTSKGVKPYETRSLKVVAGPSDYWAYSKSIFVSPQITYLFKCYLNMQEFSSGKLSFQIEEYDSNGEWLSTNWLFSKFTNYVGYEVGVYTPSSTEVNHIRVYIGSVGHGSFVACIDQVSFGELNIKRVSPSGVVVMKGRIYYEGARIPPGNASEIRVSVNLGKESKGSSKGVDQDGGFRILLNCENNPSSYNYVVYALTDEFSTLNQTVAIIVDRIIVLDMVSDAPIVDVGSTVHINVTLRYEYENAPVTSGFFVLNGLPLIHKGDGVWQCTDKKGSAQTFIYNKLEGTDELYGLSDINMNEEVVIVVWANLHDQLSAIQDILILSGILALIGLVGVALLKVKFSRSKVPQSSRKRRVD